MDAIDRSADIPLTKDNAYQLYCAIWQNIAREDSNTHNRIVWSITLTAGLFTAISFLVTRGLAEKGNASVAIATLCAVLLLAVLGIWFCYRSMLGVAAAHAQIVYLVGHYQRHAAVFSELGFPVPFGDNAGRGRPGIKSAEAFPRALLLAWVAVCLAAGYGLLAYGDLA